MNSQRVTTHNLAPESNRGFTLVELLVVIAIIGILAGIVVPNVGSYINRGNFAAAVSDVNAAQTGVATILSDTARSDFKEFLIDPPNPGTGGGGYGSTVAQQIYDGEQALEIAYAGDETTLLSSGALEDPVDALTAAYTEFFYQLLRQGKNADVAVDLRPEIRQKLANSYLELGDDPWGEPYQFWMGPMRGELVPFFRSYRVTDALTDVEDIDTLEDLIYIYDGDAKNEANAEIPGAPAEDWSKSLQYNSASVGDYPDRGLYGFPAPKDLAVYIYSKGKNNVHDANAVLQHRFGLGDYPFYGGGDDVNNWDKERGWTSAPQ